MAMLPVNVWQSARAVASPAFWMVVVPETLHEAATEEGKSQSIEDTSQSMAGERHSPATEPAAARAGKAYLNTDMIVELCVAESFLQRVSKHSEGQTGERKRFGRESNSP
jgi:hypothetical protein